MSKAKISLLSQILTLIDTTDFNSLVKKFDTDKHSKGINTRTHFVSMLFMQLASVSSLRDITNGLRSATGDLNHLGLDRAPSKSTLSYINKHRDYNFFEALYFQLLDRYGSSFQKNRLYAKRLKRKIFIMDGSIIPLSLSLFDWAKFRTTKGAIKLHAVLDYDSGLPNYACISDGKTHEIKVARQQHFSPGSVLVIDRGYVDYQWLNILDSKGVFFVTRLKRNADFESIRSFLPERDSQELRADDIIRLTGYKAKKQYPKQLRLVRVWVEEKNEEIVLLTNQMSWTADTISQLYKARWDVEVFFKHLKQLFRVKTFVGTTANAVRIQMWCSMIAMLLLRYLKSKADYNWHLSNLITFLRINLFVKIDLWQWLDKPILNSKDPPGQMELFTV